MSTGVLATISFGAAVSATWLCRRLAWRLGIVDRPKGATPLHTRPVACLGGLGIAAATVLTVILAAAGAGDLPSIHGSVWLSLIAGSTGFLALGTYDDVRPLRPGPKVVAQVVVAVAVVVLARPDASAAETIASVLWLVAVVNAVNLTDVSDGLAGSLGAVALVAVASVSPTIMPLAIIVAAATLGFLCFNRAPATIFLGDGGSHLLGFAIGGLWLLAVHETPTWTRMAGAVVGVGIFAFETAFLIVVRTRRGLPFWLGSPDHVSLRLQAAGLTRGQTVAVALLPATALGGLAQWLVHPAGPPMVTATTLAVIATVAMAWLIYSVQADPRRRRRRGAVS